MGSSFFPAVVTVGFGGGFSFVLVASYTVNKQTFIPSGDIFLQAATDSVPSSPSLSNKLGRMYFSKQKQFTPHNPFAENEGMNTVNEYELSNAAHFHSISLTYDQPFWLDPASLIDMEIITIIKILFIMIKKKKYTVMQTY